MSRQEQNVLLGALAFVTAVVLGLATVSILTGDGGEITAGQGADGADVAVDGGVVTLPGLEGAADGQTSLQPLSQDGQPLESTTSMPDVTSSSMLTTEPASPTLSSTTTEGLATTATSAPTTASTASTPVTTASTTASSTTTSTDGTGSTDSTTDPGSGSSTTTADSTTSTTMVDPTASSSSSSSTDTTMADSSTTSSSTSTSSTTSTTATVASGGVNALEQEIFRLTNQLRVDPNGPLARQGPVPDCGGSLRVDRSTGIYEPLGSLTLNEVASLQVARPWSAVLTRNLQHQPEAGAGALQAAGLNVAFVGENVSFNNYPDKALQHFVGWRESDGHFCNMMNPRFTHIGVGEVTKANGDSFATQNLFTLR